MILADTSVWIDHFRFGNAQFCELLNSKQIMGHVLVTAELSMGSLKNRNSTIEMLEELRPAPDVDLSEVRALVESKHLFSRGIGLVDASLVASCILGEPLKFWTLDRRLNLIATELGIAYQPLH